MSTVVTVKLPKSTSIVSAPTDIVTIEKEIVYSTKLGEIIRITSDKKEKQTKDKQSVTAMIEIEGILFYGTRAGQIKCLNNGKVEKLSARHKQEVVSIEVINTEAGETELATAAKDSRVHIWKLSIDKRTNTVSLLFLKTLYGPSTPITSLSLSLNNQLLLCTAEISNTARIFKLLGDTQLIYTVDHEDILYSQFLSNDTFCTITNKNTIYLYTTESTKAYQRVTSKSTIPDTNITPVLFRFYSTYSILVLGYSSGDIFIMQYKNTKLTIVQHYHIDSIPVSGTTIDNTLVIAGGKEEKHGRFIINKEFSNALYRIELQDEYIKREE
ncbi:hypothetical protein NEOKW01_0657 [Nematocida sp. AWRm80]|nr:hypothetical protein NEOKW01_0657 [Nematocida sp. AWRm80]